MAKVTTKRVVIVGGVAGGMSTATRLRRLDADVEIIVVERSAHVSYANCGLPYFVGGVIEQEGDLTLHTPESLHARFRLDVRTGTEATSIDRDAQTITVRTVESGVEEELRYDALVLSVGAAPERPPIPGYERARTLRTVEDASRMATAAGDNVKEAVVIGAGFIGLEVAENLVRHGIKVTIAEGAPQVLPPLDSELAILVQDELERNAITVCTNAVVSEITSDAVRLADGSEIKADLVVGAIGVRPETALAVEAGLTIGPNGGVAVDGANRTSDPAIYAVGDMTEKTDAVSGDTSLIALANVANRHGRRVADAIAGRTVNEAPSLGTAIVKVFDLTAATVGWSERRLRAAGRNHRVLHSHPNSHATYYPGATQMSAKLLFDPDTGEILGAQIVGQDGVDKRIDVIATAMTGALRADQLADLELAYAPPFSSAKDPVNQLGYMAENVMGGDCDVVQAAELKTLMQDGWSVIDVRTPAEHSRGAIEGSINMALDDLRNHLDELQGTNVVVYCEVGQRGHTATALLADSGISARNLDGGYRTWVDVTRSSAT